MPKYDITINMEPADVMAALKEVSRELGVRKGVYPRWIAAGKLTQSLAAERILHLEIAESILKGVVNSMLQPYQAKLDFSGSLVAGADEG
jgi:hypothetical protein